jgi:hypothetical protein
MEPVTAALLLLSADAALAVAAGRCHPSPPPRLRFALTALGRRPVFWRPVRVRAAAGIGGVSAPVFFAPIIYLVSLMQLPLAGRWFTYYWLVFNFAHKRNAQVIETVTFPYLVRNLKIERNHVLITPYIYVKLTCFCRLFHGYC